MPLPTPNTGESEDEFISRCMGNETALADFPEQEQRAAVCYRQWREAKAVTKQEADGPHPAGHYLVVEDPESPSTWHLRVRDRQGNPDHRLMGASWAALHGGYRGNVYEGPGKQEAIRKLRALYEAEGMPLPNEKNVLKAIRKDADSMTVANYIVLFGGRDLEGLGSRNVNPDGTKGEFFTPETELESSYTKTGRLYVDWEHGEDDLDPDEVLGYVDWSTAKADDRGVWVQRVLNRRNKYVAWLEELIEDGLIGTSSEAVRSRIKKATDGQIVRWPLRRDTLTVAPMEPRMITENYIQAFKALGLPVPEPEPEAEPEGATASVFAGKAPISIGSASQEVTPMSEEQTKTQELDVSALVADAASKAAQAASEKAIAEYRELLAKEKPTDKGGLVVTDDEADKAIKRRPYKGLGEFLMDVKNAALGEVDQRLLPLRSKDTNDEGGYSLNGALGDEFVGGVVKSAFMKQTGLNEGVGAAGGFLVDTDRAGGIMARVYNIGDLLRRVDMVGVSANSNGMTFNAEAETTRVDGGRRGGIRAYWTAEAGTKTPSHPTFRQIELRLRKCVGLVYATDELLQDASALESWIMRNLPEEIRFVVEDAIINGTGVGMPLGILPSGALIAQAIEAGQAAATIVSMNIMRMWSRLWAPSRRNAAWLINQDCEPELYNLALGVGTGGVALYQPPGGLSATPYATLMGRPVIATEYQPTLGTQGDIALVDLSEYQMIEKGSIQSATSIHVNFVYDETVFRFVYRVDGQPKWNQPLTPHSGAAGSTQSPFVVLAARP